MADILHTLFIHKPVEEVFKAISQGKEISKWWTNQCTGIPKLSAVYQFYFTPEYDWKATVMTCTPNSQIAFQMIDADNDWINTIIEFKLSYAEGNTITEFSHTGWATTNEHFRRSSYCWAMYLNLLKQYVETGRITVFEHRNFT